MSPSLYNELFMTNHQSEFFDGLTSELGYIGCEHTNRGIEQDCTCGQCALTNDELINKHGDEFVEYAKANGDKNFDDCMCHPK